MESYNLWPFVSGFFHWAYFEGPYMLQYYRPRFLDSNQQKLIRGQMRNSGKALLGLVLRQEGVKTNHKFPCSLLGWMGVSRSLKWGKGRG